MLKALASTGWVYLAAVIDLFSRKDVGWSISQSLATDLVQAALRDAIEKRRPDGSQLLHHSDRGCHYISNAYQQTLRTLGITCSMSRTGNCYDNAVAERFFWSLKYEWTNHRVYADLESAPLKKSILDKDILVQEAVRHAARQERLRWAQSPAQLNVPQESAVATSRQPLVALFTTISSSEWPTAKASPELRSTLDELTRRYPQFVSRPKPRRGGAEAGSASAASGAVADSSSRLVTPRAATSLEASFDVRRRVVVRGPVESFPTPFVRLLALDAQSQVLLGSCLIAVLTPEPDQQDDFAAESFGGGDLPDDIAPGNSDPSQQIDLIAVTIPEEAVFSVVTPGEIEMLISAMSASTRLPPPDRTRLVECLRGWAQRLAETSPSTNRWSKLVPATRNDVVRPAPAMHEWEVAAEIRSQMFRPRRSTTGMTQLHADSPTGPARDVKLEWNDRKISVVISEHDDGSYRFRLTVLAAAAEPQLVRFRLHDEAGKNVLHRYLCLAPVRTDRQAGTLTLSPDDLDDWPSADTAANQFTIGAIDPIEVLKSTMDSPPDEPNEVERAAADIRQLASLLTAAAGLGPNSRHGLAERLVDELKAAEGNSIRILNACQQTGRNGITADLIPCVERLMSEQSGELSMLATRVLSTLSSKE